MFDFLFNYKKYSQANLWINEMILKEQKRLAMQQTNHAARIALQHTDDLDLQLQLGPRHHKIFTVSNDKQDLEKVKEINSELDTLPLLPGFAF